MGRAAVYLASQSARTLTGTVQYSLDLLERIGAPVGAARIGPTDQGATA